MAIKEYTDARKKEKKKKRVLSSEKENYMNFLRCTYVELFERSSCLH